MERTTKLVKVFDKETKKIVEKEQVKITPDDNKCFENKANGHKFIHSITGKGLPLYVAEEDIDLYNEVSI